jgi:hypothetical protein
VIPSRLVKRQTDEPANPHGYHEYRKIYSIHTQLDCLLRFEHNGVLDIRIAALRCPYAIKT